MIHDLEINQSKPLKYSYWKSYHRRLPEIPRMLIILLLLIVIML